jgi:hypothetical protein
MPRAVRLLALSALLASTACVYDAAVKDTDVIACDGDEDCPGEASCAVAVGICDLAPLRIEIEALSVDPPVAREGVTMTLSFEVKALVHELPEVTPSWPANLEEAEGTSVADGIFRYTYAVVGDEPEDEIQGFTVEVIGDGGRNATDVAPVRFDFTPPIPTVELVGDALTSPVSHGGSVNVLARGVAEDERITGVALLAGASRTDLDVGGIDTQRLGFDVEAALSLPDPLDAAIVTAGQFRVLVEVSDPAGNSTAVETEPVLIDVELPSGTVTVPDPISTPEVELVFSDLDAAFIQLGGDVVSPLERIPAAAAVTALLTSAPGPKTITITLSDRAGNATTLQAQTNLLDGVFVTVDLTAPDGRSAARPGEVVTISGVAAVGATVTDTLGFLVDETNPVSVDASVDDSGALTGSLTLPASGQGELTVAVTVTRGEDSATVDARMDVDATPPTLALSYAEGQQGASPSATLLVDTDDDVEALTFTSADVLAIRQGGALVELGAEVAAADRFDITFTTADGIKSLSVVARDRAGHTTSDSVDFEVDSALLDANPTLSPGRVAPLAVLTIGGTATSGASVSSARAIYAGDCHTQNIEGVTVDGNGVISGSFVALEGPLPQEVTACADDVVIEVIVTDGATTSDPANSRSAKVIIDDDPPAGGPPTLAGTSEGVGGVTRETAVTVTVLATDGAGAGTVTIVGASSDVQSGPNIDTPLPMIGGNNSLALTTGVTLTSGDGPKDVAVIVTDALGNASEERVATITLDTSAPDAAFLSAVRITESAPVGAEFDPVRLDQDNTVEIEGDPGAATGADTVRLESEGETRQVIVQEDGSFGPVTLGAAALHTYTIVTRDDAGNETPATVTLPRATGVTYTPSLPSRNASFTASLTIAGAAGSSSMRIAGNNTAPGPAVHSFDYAPTGSEPELPALTVARASFEPALGALLSGSSSTQAQVVSFDFTDPTVVNTLPGALTVWDGLPEIRGTALDNGSLAGVHVSIREVSTGRFWDGPIEGFSSQAERVFVANGLANWNLAGVIYTGGQYTIRSFAVDTAGNIGPAISNTFTWDDGDGTPVGVTARGTAPQRIEVNWSAPQFGVDEYVLFWDITAGVGGEPPASDQGASPIVINASETKFTLTGLPRNFYELTLEGRRDGSKFPVQRTVPSKAFEETFAGGPSVMDLAVEPGLAVLGMLNGDIAFSEDNGETWNVVPAKTPNAAFVDLNGGRAVVVASSGQVALYDHGQGTYEARASSGISSVGAIGFDGQGGILVASQSADELSRSLDQGASFLPIPSTPGLRITSVTHPPGSNRLLAVGADNAGGHVSYAPNGLGTMAQVFAPLGETLVAGAVHGEDSVLLVCGNVPYRSTNDGGSFDPVPTPTEAPCQALAMDRDAAIIAVDDGQGAELLESGDAGGNWDPVGNTAFPVDDISISLDRDFCAVYRVNEVFCRLGSAPPRVYSHPESGRRLTRVNVIEGQVISTGFEGGEGFVFQYGP